MSSCVVILVSPFFVSKTIIFIFVLFITFILYDLLMRQSKYQGVLFRLAR